MEAGKQVAVISFFKYEGRNRIWGMRQMYDGRFRMKQMKGLQFFKLFGTGGGFGFSMKPDFSTFGLLSVWKSHKDADDFFSSQYFEEIKQKFVSHYSIYLLPLSSKGSWSSFSQWEIQQAPNEHYPIAAITYASIKASFLPRFWKMVPHVFTQHHYPGLLFSKGFGEYPLIQMATFSIWENAESMNNFAYNTFHGEAIRVTRKHNGFKEEMFARFLPVKTIGGNSEHDPVFGEKKEFQTEWKY
jgi:spheroidene monooxygenase